MADKKTAQHLNWIFGDTPSSTTPSQGKGRGGRISGARKAGVTTDHRLTPMAQELAAEIEQDALEKERLSDPRSAFEKKYDIRDGVSYVTPEKFRDIFINNEVLKVFRKKAVRKIVIDDGIGSSAVFDFFPDNTLPTDTHEDYDHLDVVKSRQIIERGIFSCLGNRSAVLLRRQTKGFHGVLKSMQVPAELARHSSIVDSSAPSQRYTANMNPYLGRDINKDGDMVQGNARGIFQSLPDFQRFISTLKDVPSGHVITTDIPNILKEKDSRIGVLFLAEHFHGDRSNMPEISVNQIGPRLAANRSMTSDQFLTHVFEDHAGYVLKSYGRRKNSPPLAVLVRFSDDISLPSPENT